MEKINKKVGAGIDIVGISRFKKLLAVSKNHQLKKLFSDQEILYCKSFKDSAVHFAGHFAAKEAASKALGVKAYPFIKLEIRHDKNGAPEVYYREKGNDKRLPVKVSISHTDTIAIAMAL